MSRTDRHRPVWVQIRDNGPEVRIVHDHATGPCDFDWDNAARWMSTPRFRRGTEFHCYADIHFYGWPYTQAYGKIHHHKSCKTQYHRAQRARWQVLKSKLRSRDPEDVQDELGFRPRGTVQWDEW